MYLAVKRELQAISNAVATAGLALVRLSHAELHHRYAAARRVPRRGVSDGEEPAGESGNPAVAQAPAASHGSPAGGTGCGLVRAW